MTFIILGLLELLCSALFNRSYNRARRQLEPHYNDSFMVQREVRQAMHDLKMRCLTFNVARITSFNLGMGFIAMGCATLGGVPL